MPKKIINPMSFFKNKEAPKGQFKQAANDNNGNINSINKALGSHFSSQQSQIKALSSNISNIEEKAQQTAKKVDSTNSLLQQSIAVQNTILRTLKTLVSKVETIEKNDIGGDKEKNDSLGKRLLKGMGLSAAAIGLITGASIIGNNNIGANPEGGSQIPEYTGKGVEAKGSAKEAIDFFVNKGWSREQAIGIASNLEVESKFQTNAIGDGGKAYGIAQWHPDRQANFEKVYNKKIRDSNFQEQLEFVNWELNNTEKRAGDLLRKAKSAGEAADIIDEHYERSKGIHRKQRINIAQKYEKSQDSAVKVDTSKPQPDLSVSGETGSFAAKLQSNETSTDTKKSSETPEKSKDGQVIQDQEKVAAIRKEPISTGLLSVLEKAAAAAGVIVRVQSGGQPAEGGKRTGSTRHDRGMAADIDLYSGDRKLTPRNSEDLQIFKKFVAAASAAGATGIGAGEDYMSKDGSRIHVGFGSQALWGAGGSGKNAADWLREAVGGIPGGESPGPNLSRRESYAGSPMRGMMNPMRNTLAGIGGLFGPKGAAIGGIAGMLLPTIENILGDIQSENKAGAMQSGASYDQAKLKRNAIDQAAVKKETEQQPAAAAPKQQETPQQQSAQQNTVTPTITDTAATPEWIGSFRAGIKHAYLDFDGKMIYI